MLELVGLSSERRRVYAGGVLAPSGQLKLRSALRQEGSSLTVR